MLHNDVTVFFFVFLFRSSYIGVLNESEKIFVVEMEGITIQFNFMVWF